MAPTRLGGARLALLTGCVVLAASRLVAQTVPDSGVIAPLAGLVTVLDGARLRAAGVQTVADALRSVPGVNVSTSGASAGGTATLGADGGGAEDVVVRWDGVPLGGGDGVVDLAHLTLDGVDRIEVRRGAAADLAGGGATAVVVDIRTMPAASRRTLGAEVVAGGDRTVLTRGAVTSSSGPWVISLGASSLGTDGGIVAGERYSRWAGVASVRLVPLRSAWIHFSGRRSGTRYDFPAWYIGMPPAPGLNPGHDQVQRGILETVSLQTGVALSRRLSASAMIGHNKRDDHYAWHTDPIESGPLVVERETGTARTQAAASATFRSSDGLEATLALEHDEGKVSYEGVLRADVDPSSPAWRVWSTSSREHRWSVTAWRGDVTARRGPFSLSGALRWDSRRWGGTPLTWRALAVWTSPRGTEVRVGGRTGYRVHGWDGGLVGLPAPVVLVLSPTLAPEHARSLEASVVQRVLDGRLSLTATLLEQRFSQFPGSYPVAAGSTWSNLMLANLGTARARGFELRLRTQPLAALTVEAALTHLPARAISSGLLLAVGPFVVGEPLPGRPDDIAVVGATMTLACGGILDLRIRHVGRRLALNSAPQYLQRDTIPSFTTVDVGGRVPLGARASVVFRVENLFDARYEEVVGEDIQVDAGSPGRRRAAVIGVRLEIP